MRLNKLLRFSYLLVLPLVLTLGNIAWASICAATSSGGVCCESTWQSGDQCCWSIGCSDGSGDGGCSTCVVAKVKEGLQDKNPATLLAQLLVRDKELSRALASIR